MGLISWSGHGSGRGAGPVLARRAGEILGPDS